MASKDFNSDTAQGFYDRINVVKEETKRLWGKMSPAQMMAHLKLSVQGGLGEIPIEDHSNFFFKLLRPVLFSGLIPTPKGRAPTVPEYEVDSCGSFDEEQKGLLDALNRFLDLCEAEPDSTPQHPLFGEMTIPQWQRGHALHFDHHLRQFGA